MARNRYDRDDSNDRDYYGRDARADNPRGGERYNPERGFGGRSGSLDRDYGHDDSYGARRGGGANFGDGGRGGYGRDDYGRGGYGERADYRADERRYAEYQGGRGDARREYGRHEDERSWYEGRAITLAAGMKRGDGARPARTSAAATS